MISNSRVKSSLIQVLMAKANEQLDAIKDAKMRARIIGSTVNTMLPILREQVSVLDNTVERIKTLCANVGRK